VFFYFANRHEALNYLALRFTLSQLNQN
jgi:hypothetical protein